MAMICISEPFIPPREEGFCSACAGGCALPVSTGLAPGQHQVSAAVTCAHRMQEGPAHGTPAADPGPALAPRAWPGPRGCGCHAPPSSRHPGPTAPPSAASVFLVSHKHLPRMPGPPGASSRRRFPGWLWDVCCRFSGGGVSSPRSPASWGWGGEEAQMQSQAP